MSEKLELREIAESCLPAGVPLIVDKDGEVWGYLADEKRLAFWDCNNWSAHTEIECDSIDSAIAALRAEGFLAPALLTDENITLRQQLQLATSELTAAKLVIEAAERVNARWKLDFPAPVQQKELHIALSTYGAEFPGSEEK